MRAMSLMFHQISRVCIWTAHCHFESIHSHQALSPQWCLEPMLQKAFIMPALPRGLSEWRMGAVTNILQDLGSSNAKPSGIQAFP